MFALSLPSGKSPSDIRCDIFRDYVSFSLHYKDLKADPKSTSDGSFDSIKSYSESSTNLDEYQIKIPKNAINVKVFKGQKPEVLIQSILEEKTLMENAEILLLSENGVYNMSRTSNSSIDPSVNTSTEKVILNGNITYMNEHEVIVKKGKTTQKINQISQ